MFGECVKEAGEKSQDATVLSRVEPGGVSHEEEAGGCRSGEMR